MIENFSFKATIEHDVIEIEQRDFEHTQVICLAPSQLRAIAEHFGLVPPQYPADELTKRLARQLCEIRKMLADETSASPWIEMAFHTLNAYCNSLPDSIFPFAMFEEETEPNPQAKATGKPTALPTEKPPFELTHSA